MSERRWALVLAAGFWLWTAFMAFGAGGIGAGFSCEQDGCLQGSPSWL